LNFGYFGYLHWIGKWRGGLNVIIDFCADVAFGVSVALKRRDQPWGGGDQPFLAEGAPELADVKT